MFIQVFNWGGGFPADIAKYADRNTLRIYAFSVICGHPDFSRPPYHNSENPANHNNLPFKINKQ